MLNLPQVTLVTVTSVDKENHEAALRMSQDGIKFGAVKLLDLNTHSIDEWNKAVIKELPKHIDTEFALLIHADGYIIHPELWDNDWLNYDFIGAPWPLPRDDYSYRDEEGGLVRVGNSVSLRSKKLMDLASTRKWQSYFGNTNEDGFICCHNRLWLESKGCNFAPLEAAIHFSKEHIIDENRDIMNTFCFHSL